MKLFADLHIHSCLSPCADNDMTPADICGMAKLKGLDMIAVPGTTSAATLAGILADEAAIGMINQKTTAVRLIPVVGKGVGESAEFGGLLGYAPIIPVNSFDCSAFVNRKGRIPAPVHSFKN